MKIKKVTRWSLMVLAYFGLFWGIPFWPSPLTAKESLYCSLVCHAIVIGVLCFVFLLHWLHDED